MFVKRSVLLIYFIFSFAFVSAHYDAETLEQKLFAVHVTRVFPKDGHLKAGLYGKEKLLPNQPEELIPDFRCTVHFSLGEMVRPVEGVSSWEDCPIGIVVPLFCLMPQAINLNCYDTFVLGDYRLQEVDILVLPIQYKAKMPDILLCNVHYYNPKASTLRQAIDQVIAQRGGWSITMNTDDKEDELNEAILDGKNVNTREFFAPLLEGRPYLGVGCRFDKWDGEAYRFGQLETQFYEIGHQHLQGETIPREIFCKAKHEIFKKLEQLDLYVSSLPFNSDVYREKREHLFRLMDHIEEEVLARSVYTHPCTPK